MLTMLWTSLFFTILLSICISCDSIDDRKGRTGLNDSETQTTQSLRRNLQDTCMVQQNTELCPGLTANQAPEVDCACYNYCGSDFAGCCAIDDMFCSVSCSSLGEGEVLTAGCQLPDTPTPAPPPAQPSTPMPAVTQPPSAPVEQAGTCLLEENTERCPGLTANQSPVENCGCYNYCGSVFQGCCQFESGCSVTCPSLIPGEVITTGCQLPDNAPPVTTPPAEPTAAPIDEGPSCLLIQNTDNCPLLIQDQSPEVDCDCYNYCGGVFQGCCPFDSGCAASCSSLGAGEVLTAGCVLGSSPPDDCKTYGDTCIESTECCSARCLFGFCQTPPPRTDTRVKLSTGRGGAAGRAKDVRSLANGPGIRRRATIRGQ